ncbi:MAG: glycosyltransferase [Nitrospiria bacterium]
MISPVLWLGKDPQNKYPVDEIRTLLNLCDLILPNSETELNQLSVYFDIPKEKFHVTKNGVDPSFSADVSQDLFRDKYDIRTLFLLNVANIEERKNQLNLVRALKGTGLSLVIIGNIRDKEYFESCMREGGTFVKYLGYLEHTDDILKSAYKACELFILPSLLETPGLSALEAGIAGARIVITEVGCTGEYFGDKVTYINPFDPENIRRNILEEMGKKREGKLKKHILENFLWDKTAQQVREAYLKVLKKEKD